MSSLFAGIGGFEVAANRCGITTSLQCEIDPAAKAVLAQKFPQSELIADIRDVTALPSGTFLLTAGFPCQDLSSVGKKSGIDGERSSLVNEVIRLLESSDPEWVVLENVMFMLHLDRGRAMQHVLTALESLGFNWAYRLLDTQHFGLPQRRRRVYFVASRTHDASAALFTTHNARPGPSSQAEIDEDTSIGFYWTEGTYAAGVTANGVPPLKSGSTIGIPSPPAVLMPYGLAATPTIVDAERLQGFRANWTSAVRNVGRESLRWRLVGNAVSVPVARAVIGSIVRQTDHPTTAYTNEASPLREAPKNWPHAAFGNDRGRWAMPNGRLPGMKRSKPIHEFLSEEPKPLSERATRGFLGRARKGRLRFPPGFLETLDAHLKQIECSA